MRIEDKTIMVTVKNDIELLNDIIQLTVVHTVFLNKNEVGDVTIDIELVDFEEITFAGKEIKSMKDLRSSLALLGVDFDDLVEEECIGMFMPRDIEMFKRMYQDIKNQNLIRIFKYKFKNKGYEKSQ